VSVSDLFMMPNMSLTQPKYPWPCPL